MDGRPCCFDCQPALCLGVPRRHARDYVSGVSFSVPMAVTSGLGHGALHGAGVDGPKAERREGVEGLMCGTCAARRQSSSGLAADALVQPWRHWLGGLHSARTPCVPLCGLRGAPAHGHPGSWKFRLCFPYSYYLYYFILYYVILCYILSCYVMLCYIMLYIILLS